MSPGIDPWIHRHLGQTELVDADHANPAGVTLCRNTSRASSHRPRDQAFFGAFMDDGFGIAPRTPMNPGNAARVIYTATFE